MTTELPAPKSRKESYLAKAAGEDVTIPEKPLSRTEQYLAAIAEGGGGGGGTSDFDQLTNRPKYNGAPMTGETNIPESTTYTAGDGIDIVAGVIKTTNTGKARELTTNDYNYPTDIPTRVALWLLEPGLYHWGSDISVYGSVSYNYTGTPGTALVMRGQSSDSVATILTINASNDRAIYSVNLVNGVPAGTVGGILVTGDIKNNLNSTASNQALSANQGKVLNDKIEGRVITGAGAPTTSTVGTVGMVYEDTTNGKLYICTAIVPGTDPDPDTYTWAEVGAGGGGVTELTSADYNWPATGTKIGIAYWLLSDGIYHSDENVYWYHDASVNDGKNRFVLVETVNSSYKSATFIETDEITYLKNANTTGVPASGFPHKVLKSSQISQSTGTSSNIVMSQNAVTSMVYADPSTGKKVRLGNTVDMNTATDAIAVGAGVSGIGAYATAVGPYSSAGGANSVAIGQGANAGFKGSVAIGDNAITHYMGEVTIGTNYTGTGYNNSNYRLLTGLYDPQSAHDAATKGYVDGTAETYTIATSDWSALSASSPYDYQATVTATYTIGANTIAELLNDSPVEFATHGFAIGSISSQSVTIYSIGQPSASVSLKVNYKG